MVCDSIWLVILATEDTDAMEFWALDLRALDGVSRHVPGDTKGRIWSAGEKPCLSCRRWPHGRGCELAGEKPDA